MLIDITWTETKNQIVDTKMALVLMSELQKKGINDISFKTVRTETS